MKPIDFLPERYCQAKKRRNTSYYRLGVTILFVVAFAAAAGGLHVKQLDVRRQSENINKQYAADQAQSALLANKQSELAKLNVYAALVTHLRHPWPKSRLIYELVAPLPAEVMLCKVEISAVPRPAVATEEAATAGSDTSTTAKPSVETDLQLSGRKRNRKIPSFISRKSRTTKRRYTSNCSRSWHRSSLAPQNSRPWKPLRAMALRIHRPRQSEMIALRWS